MDFASSIQKAKDLLAPGGRILVVGLARPKCFTDFAIEGLYVLPAKLGSLIHGEQHGGGIEVPTLQPTLSLREVTLLADQLLPRARIRRGLYYRYLLSCAKP